MYVLRRLPNESGRPHRALVVVTAIVITIIIVVWRLLDTNPDEAELFILVIPVALLAVGFGVRGGFVGAAVALGIYFGWLYGAGIDLRLVELFEGPLTFITVALAVGTAIDSMRRVRAVLNAVLEDTSDAIYVKNLDGRYIMINKAMAASLELDKSEILGHSDAELKPVAVASSTCNADKEVMFWGIPLTSEDTTVVHDEEHIDLCTRGPLRNRFGRPIGTYGISRDITERRKVERGEVEDANQRGEEYQRARRDYSQLVRHRLMNPLTVISGNAQTLRDLKTIDPELHDRMCDLIIESADEIEQVSLAPETCSAVECNLDALPHVDAGPSHE